MQRLRLGIILLAVAVASGCAGEDGSDGDAYAYLSGTSDIEAVDLTEVGLNESIYYSGTKYGPLSTGQGTIYWISSGSLYGLAVVIEDGESGDSGSVGIPVLNPPEDGDDGRDRIYEVLFSGNTMYVDEYFEFRDHAPAPRDSIPGMQRNANAFVIKGNAQGSMP